MNNDETLLDYQKSDQQVRINNRQKKDYTSGNMAAAAAAGVVVGAGATFGGQAVAANAAEYAIAPEEQQEARAETTSPKIAIVDETQNFVSAFNEARSEVGAGGVFEYHGKLYNTYTEEEWSHMSKGDQNAFAEQVKPMADKVEVNYEATVQAIEANHPANINVIPVEATSEVNFEAPRVSNDDMQVVSRESQETEIHVLGVEHNVDMNGQQVDVAAIKIGGHNGLLVDVNQDGTANIGFIDMNDNGQVDQGEVGDITRHGMQMPGSNPDANCQAGADDMPDNTNEAAFV